ncbi:ABC transporter substrate-binding protein [Amycolatopsis sp. GM8]|uniref:ABC transporter substrate-binding protein n=1 Tax=Amycolatopsis sp. GM8 TaxID=2896530 RepID=UPI001F2712A8|nr:ABC transporter substrate-binding protein [Amycolatopsis sp. GM8]
MIARLRIPGARRRWLAVGAIAVVALTGCSVNGGAGQQQGSTLRVVAAAEPPSMNPVQSSSSDARVWGPIFDSLVKNDPATGQVTKDGLLTGWQQQGKDWTFTVRQGVSFTNGEKFDATAAAFAIDQCRTDPAAIVGAWCGNIANAKTQGADLVVETKLVYNDLPKLLTMIYAIPPQQYASAGKAFSRAPVGTGPYKVLSYTPGSSLKLERNDSWWGGKPLLAGIDFSWAADPSTRASYVATGQADVALDLTPEAAATLKSKSGSGTTIESSPIDSFMILVMMTDKPPFDNVVLRQAVAHAIDKQAIVKALFPNGGADRLDSLFKDLLNDPKSYNPEPPAYDPAEAKRLVAQLGGTPEITLSYTTNRAPKDAQLGEAVAGMLEKAGIQVRTNPLDYAKYREQQVAKGMEIYIGPLLNIYRSVDVPSLGMLSPKGVTQNCSNPEYLEAREKGLAATSPAEQDRVFSDLDHRVFTDDVCDVPLIRYDGTYGLSTRVKGWQVPLNLVPDYTQVSVG